MADPEPPAEPENPSSVAKWPGLPSARPDYYIHLNALHASLSEMLNAGWAPTGSQLWHLQRAVETLHVNTCVLLTLIAKMLDVGFGVYDWPTWAEDTPPESGKATADIAAGVLVGLDRLIGKVGGG